MILYHGTPHQFTILNRCSWLATSPEEAAANLVLKNIELRNEDYISGYIMEVDVDDEVMNTSGYFYPIPGHYLSMDEHRIIRTTPLKELIGSFIGTMKFLGNITETWDLTNYI